MQRDRQLAAVLVVGQVDVLLEQRLPEHGREELEGLVGVRDAQEQCGRFVADLVDGQVVVGDDAANVAHVEGSQPHAQGDDDALLRLPGPLLEHSVLPARELQDLHDRLVLVPAGFTPPRVDELAGDLEAVVDLAVELLGILALAGRHQLVQVDDVDEAGLTSAGLGRRGPHVGDQGVE